ncbi:alpha/beta-hydrolase [Penicillium pulvis]|uniref:alpha/beta-hydrolase n=1 Tax=Penicillium pulvis TaxID=1562058 RepID=UPI0025473516|nr:alpha/beta-hydrolase [Penicillium pulvis]KAJ5806537.1 alpha/beta-hydrolase [Penicillium pulvis]
MSSSWIHTLASSLLLTMMVIRTAIAKENFKLRPFEIDLSDRVPRMIRQIQESHLPQTPVYTDTGTSAGITLSDLKSFKQQWLTSFDWNQEQTSLNKFSHYTAEIEGLTVHFIHEKSGAADAIPLLLIHGWPGSFLEFIPLINDLTKTAKIKSGKLVSFDVIVLDYEEYATFGTDWGSGVAYSLYDQWNTTVRAAHLDFLPFYPLSSAELAAENITLTGLEDFEEDVTITWSNEGTGYFSEQTTKPNTIGLALYDNPIGQLAWIGEKFMNWSDPDAGHAPSVLTRNEILRSVSLYYLTESFASSVVIYAQNPNGFSTVYSKASNDAPLLFSAFKYNPGFWPPALVAKVGNLVYYKNHGFGGHFPGLDNPPALLQDLREIGSYWDVNN